MFRNLSKFIGKVYHKQEGITGLETAIILIAFVTVAAVLAYTVLSAGIFSSERGKEAVYGGLGSASSTLELKGSVVADTNGTKVTDVTFSLALAIPGSKVDKKGIVINYWDTAFGGAEPFNQLTEGALNDWTYALSSGSTERGLADVLEGDEQMVLVVKLPGTVKAYDSFVIQVVPPTGATLTIQRTLPGNMDDVLNLN
jgi:archaeal flagellin FlaB